MTSRLPEPAEPLGLGSLVGLDLHRGYSPVCGFEDDVGLGAGVVLSVEQGDVGARPGELAEQLVEYELLDKLAGRRVGGILGRAGVVHAVEATAHAAGQTALSGST